MGMAGKPGMGKYRAGRGVGLIGRPLAQQQRWWEERLAAEQEELAQAVESGDRRLERLARRWIADTQRRLGLVRQRIQDGTPDAAFLGTEPAPAQ